MTVAEVIFVEGNGDGPGVRLTKSDGVIRATWDPPPNGQENDPRLLPPRGAATPMSAQRLGS